ncbi:AMP-binding protein [Nakamurella alba]|uniref:AMP-binding protein n=1 Tax=Nakamurella alba TaxID=2665158 RepID=UPI0018AB734D|nr:AMP-binding protein [Nakamurella alba]
MTESTTATTIGTWLDEAAARDLPDSAWRIDGVATSARRLAAESATLAPAVAALEPERGAPVCLLMRTSTTMLRLWFALARAGIVDVPLNVASGAVVLRYLIADAGARVVVCDVEFLDQVLAEAPELPLLTTVLVHDPERAVPTTTVADGRVTVRDLAGLADGPTAPLPEVAPDDISTVLYTSGTTGPPKGVLLTHRFNLHLIRHTSGLMGYTPADRLYSVFPLFHSNARYTSVGAAIETGAGLVMHRRFSASRFWDICRDEAITAFNYQGAMMAILFQLPARADDRDHAVRVAFGAPCPAEIFAPFEERFGVTLTEVYGSTEVSNVCNNPPHARRIGAGGRPSPQYSVQIVDEHDDPVPVGADGEIVVRPNAAGWIFRGYLGKPEATVAAWRNLWFHTGDRGRMDADGFVHFLDRMSDTIRRRGENISTWEIERVVQGHPAVERVAAYAVPSELSESEVMISVVPVPDVPLTPADVLEYCTGRLTAQALPRYVRLVGELPLTPSQRTEKFRLRATGVTADTWDREATGV